VGALTVIVLIASVPIGGLQIILGNKSNY